MEPARRLSCGLAEVCVVAVLLSATHSEALSQRGDSQAQQHTPRVIYQETLTKQLTRAGVLPSPAINDSDVEYRYWETWSASQPSLPMIYLPIGWSARFWRARQEDLPPKKAAQNIDWLERFLAGLDRQHSYYSVSHVAGLIRAERIDIPCDLKLTLFVAEGEQDIDHAPHLRVVPIPWLGSTVKPRDGQRRWKATFSGGMVGGQDKAKIRSRMAARLSGLNGYRIHTGHVSNWRELITNSDFALCPRGRAPTTLRMYEALTAETIPIVIWWNSLWLPFKDKLDWKTIALIVHKDNTSDIPDLIARSDVTAMRQRVRESRPMWTYEYTAQYITETISKAASDPSTYEYRVNDTICEAGNYTTVHDRMSRVRRQRRATRQYSGPFTYWDAHDFTALAVVAAALSFCGFKLGVRWHNKQQAKRRLAQQPEPPGNGGSATDKPFKRRSDASVSVLMVDARGSP